MSYGPQETTRDLRRAKDLIESVLQESEAEPVRTNSATTNESMTSVELPATIEELLLRDSSAIRIGLGTAGYGHMLSAFIDRMTNATAKFSALSSPDLHLDTAASNLTAECLDGCRVSHFQVPNWVLVDDVCALIESSGPGSGMVTITSRPVIEILVSWFDQVWLSSPKYDVHARLRERRECELTREIIAFLARGVKDETAADRLGMSVRTYRRHISELYGDLGAQSRFQAGIRAERLLVRYWTAPG